MPLDGTLYEDGILQTLNEAQDRIRDPKKWTTQTLARDEDGNPVDPSNKCAVAFCAKGALNVTCRRNRFDVTDELDRVARGIGYTGVVSLNDNGNHTLVMRLFDVAKAARAAQILEEVAV